ncbi:mediator of RNA polymerase II transcription subunit-like protein [Rhynchospora pubera]|uniref:Mediator of RNA polymerase II transcription subunit-like protein n=1 Tax=Rhynchospora pubera TaxID=906938 RepID=A0AAV8CZD1_9POAL|nr:mediator of RNA polymerase II transcription subunit-like protein [Rhynchospora pubera]
MERAEPAFKPEWLKSSNHVSSNHLVGTSPHSDDQGVGISSRNGPASVDRDRKSLASTRRSLSSNGSRNYESGSGKSKAYSSFGSCRRERDRVRDYELQRDRRSSHLDNGFDERLSDNSLRRSLSMVSARPAVSDTWAKGVNGSTSTNGVVSRSGTTTASFEKEFPSLGENGRHEPVRVSSPGITALQSIPIGVENWNSVLVEVPPAAVSNGLSSGNGSVAGNGLSGSSPVLSQTSVTAGPGTGLNMAETVAQAPSRVRTPPQLTVDTQRLEELTLKQFKQLIPVTPSMPKSSLQVSSSLDKKSKSHPHSSQPLSPAFRGSVRPTSDNTKPAQTSNFLVLNRDKSGISLPIKEPTPVGTKPAGLTAAPVASAVPLKSPTNRDRRMHSQSREKLEFFRFIRNQSSGASQEHDKDLTADAGPSGSCTNPPFLEKETAETGGVLRACEEVERRLVISDGEVDPDPDVDFVDPEEEAFLRSLGWDQNAEVVALTNEEIEAFIAKYKDLKQPPKSASEERSCDSGA